MAQRILRRILEPAGYTLIEANSGTAALEQYQLHHPDLVLLDLIMPDMDGFALLRYLKELDPHCRVVVASADIQHSSQEEAHRLGATGFVTKPFTSEKVLKAVSDALEE